MAFPLVAGALTVGRALITKIGLKPGTLAKAGAWLKNALWGSNFAKATTVISGAALLAPKSAAQSSQAAAQLTRYNG